MDKIEKIIRKIEQIPTLPIVSRHIMTLLEDDEVPLKKIAEVIEKDMALAANLLKIANSPFYGTLSKISSIDHAIAILGISEVKAMLMASSIHHFFSTPETHSLDRKRFWHHSIICSQIAKHLSLHFKTGGEDGLFLAALIHDMGKIIFDRYFHDEFITIIDTIREEHESFSMVEKRVLGATHYQIAAKIMQQWNFPESVTMLVFYHHAPWQDKNHTTSSIIVYLANILAKIVGYPCMEEEKKIDVTSFCKSKAMKYIVQSGFDLDEKKFRTLIKNIRKLVADEGRSILSIFQ
ncbi:MAG: HDOD domain-containing protein [Desulfobulbaceae bacterium]|nr:HDOD domain-containing protein [Desulfobulbaceae bacterium]MCK5339633.1 HDOD domain-containing protein [Desulfobulbaceae bacterium]